ncbi:MAG: carbohydrate binding domain-containing protein, partial [Planctomycetota bacterium]
MKNLFFAMLIVSMISSVAMAQKANIVRNGSFEKDTDGDGMSDQWQFAGDQGVAANWMRDVGFVGRFSQKLTCTQFKSLSPASHVMLCQVYTVRLEKGRWYKISFAARQQGISGKAVHIAISNTKSWTNCGLQESFRAYSEWREFEFVFRATETVSANIRLQFWYTSTGSFWLDNVRLESSEPPVKRFTEAISPTTGVNLLPNSSFECGVSGWGSIADLPGWGGNLNLPVGEVDPNTGKFHGSSFKIALTPETIPVFYFDYFPLYRVPVKAPLLANRGWITVESRVSYTLSAYMKADCDGLTGMLSVNQAFRGSLHREVQLTDKWQRHTFTFQPQAGQVFVALGLDLEASHQEAGTVWIDAVQLEKGTKATPYSARAEVEVGLEANQLGNIFPYGDEPEMTATVFNGSRLSKSVTLNVRTTNFDNDIVHEAAITTDVPSGQVARVPVCPGVRRKGFYRLHLSSSNAEGVINHKMRFAIIEPHTNSDSLFGMNHAYPWPHLLDLSKKIGLCWFRDWSLKWHD